MSLPYGSPTTSIVGSDFDRWHANVRALMQSTIRDNHMDDRQRSGDDYVGAGIWISSYAAARCDRVPHSDAIPMIGGRDNLIIAPGNTCGGPAIVVPDLGRRRPREGFYAEPGSTTTSRNNVTGMSIASMFGSVYAMPGSAFVGAANANAPAPDPLGRPRRGAPGVEAQELR